MESGKRLVRKVLVEGDAGIGKTTLCIAVSEDWANGKLFQQFELVLLLPLRMKAVASAGSVPELLNLLHSSPKIQDSVANYLEVEEGKQVLIIADGWDELSESERQSGAFLYQFLFHIFPLISVIVTSRPFASTQLHTLSCIDRFVEVQGFSKENIREYMQHEFASNQRKAISLLEQLEQNPLIESVCSIPLNCAIVCHLWRTLEEVLPTTMTELYTKIILNIILRNIQKADVHKNILSLSNLNELPADLQESWSLLCEFAFLTFENDQLVFSQKELADFFPQGLALNEKILCFGLLQSAESIFDMGRVLSFHFLHLTFQEYLAALYLVKRLVDRQSLEVNFLIKVFERHGLEKRFFIILRFFFGIYFKILGCSDFALVKPCLSNIGSFLNHCHIAFESRNGDIDTNTFSLLRKIGFTHCHPSTAHDCAAILYVMDKMPKCYRINIYFGNYHVTENQIRTLTNSLVRLSKTDRLRIEKLDLNSNQLTYASVEDLLIRASSAFQSLESLNLRFNKFEPEKIATMLANSSCRSVSYLDLCGNNLGVSGLQALEKVVSDDWLANLEYLDLSGCLTDDANTNAAALETFLKALENCCPNLCTLDLSNNNLGTPGASILAEVIKSYRLDNEISPHEWGWSWLKSVNLNNTKLGDEGLCALIKILEGSCWFEELYLQSNGIHATGAQCLAESMNCSVVVARDILWDECHLDLEDNQLGVEGIIAIGEILSRCHQTDVNLCRCHLTIAAKNNNNMDNPTSSHDFSFRDVGQQLCQMPKNYTVRNLILNYNCFTGKRVHILAGLILICENLMYLSCVNCSITSNDLKKLLEIFAKSYPDRTASWMVSVWDLEDNRIDDKGVFALMHHVTSQYSLPKDKVHFLDRTEVCLDGNPVSQKNIKIVNNELYSYNW